MTLEERIISTFENVGSIAKTAEITELNTAVVRKVLISNGIIPTPKSDKVSEYLEKGFTTKQIAEILEIKEKSLNGYLPYSKTPYVIGEKLKLPPNNVKAKVYGTWERKGGNKMPYNIFSQLLSAAVNAADYDEYCSKAKSMVKPNIYEDADYDIDKALNNIYAFAHEQTYRNLAQLCGATNRYVAKTYNVPVKTVEKWRSGYSNPAIYILNLLAADMLTQ